MKGSPLKQKSAALALGAGLLAVPLLPITADAVLPERDWSAAADESAPLELITENGDRVAVRAIDGWQVTDHGSSVRMRGERAVVVISAYDRSDRDPAAVAHRLMRANRIGGVSAAFDGGVITAKDETSLAGDTCVAVTATATGSCAFLYDDDVVVSVIALAEPQGSVPPIDAVAELVSRAAAR